MKYISMDFVEVLTEFQLKKFREKKFTVHNIQGESCYYWGDISPFLLWHGITVPQRFIVWDM